MAEMRPLEREDVPAVAALLRANLTETPEERIRRDINGFLDDPWADPELPSLVAVEDREIIGFIGAQVRRFRFGDRVLRAVCPSHLTVAAGRRGGAAGALMLRKFLTSGQDFTFSDTANNEVVRIWQALGGRLDHARAFDWMIVLRPLRWVGSLGASVFSPGERSDRIPVGALPFRAIRPRANLTSPGEGVSSEPADAGTVVENLPAITAGLRLRGEYDQRFLEHLFAEVEGKFGRLERRLVRRGERPVGWYAYVPNSGGIGRLLQLLCAERETEAVFADLVVRAHEDGCAVLSGRHEPHLTQTLGDRLPVLGFARRPVVHCHDPEILATLAGGKSALTLLDGEWFVF
jgi:hypothetical protein